MATITLRKDKINGVGGLIDSIVKSSNKLDTQLGTLRNTLQGVDSSTCNLQGVVSSISSSSKSEKEKVADLKRLNSKLTDFITMTARRDADAKSAVERSKNDFYSKYSYLKPECEKNVFEHICDGLQSVGEWCKEHWKLIVVAILVVVAIVVIVVTWGAATGPLLLLAGAAKGLLAGALIGGLMGGASSALTGGSFLDGFEDGAFSGAIMGALTGALGGAGQLLGGSCKVLGALGTVAKYMPSIAKITGGLSLAMGVFDLASFGIGMFDPNNPIVLLNQNLHSSTAYNVFQIGVTAVAVFSGGFTRGMQNPSCFIAGTMVLTANGLMAIEAIKQGDMIYAADPETLRVSLKRVLDTFVKKASKLVYLTVNGETIVSTFDHPYYVKNKGFVNACDLWIGAELADKNGNTILVEQLYHEELNDKTTTVYNIKVEKEHTYFVGCSCVLVHNLTCGKTSTAFDQDEFDSTLDERIAHTPSPNNENVKFADANNRGNCKCVPREQNSQLAKTLNKYGVDGIEYKNGTIDLSPTSHAEVNIDGMSASRSSNFTKANGALADQLNKSPSDAKILGITPKNGHSFTSGDIRGYMKKNGLTWHELNNKKTMQMVPSIVNKKFTHLGGVGEVNIVNSNIMKGV